MVKAACEEWFSKLNCVQLKNYIFEDINQIIKESILKNDSTIMNKFIQFLKELFKFNENKQISFKDEVSFNQVYNEQLYNLFCILKIYTPLIGKLLIKNILLNF